MPSELRRLEIVKHFTQGRSRDRGWRGPTLSYSFGRPPIARDEKSGD
jgi:hypothetical protein